MRKKRAWELNDPQANKESNKYVTPVPSRVYLLQVFEDIGAPISLKSLGRHLELYDHYERQGLKARLSAMVRDGQLIQNRKGDFCLTEKIPVIIGTVLAKRDGFGFLLPEDDSQDVYLSSSQMHSLMDGDRIAVRISGYDKDGRAKGTVVEILERAHSEVVGRLLYESGTYFVEAANRRLVNQPVLIPKGARRKAKTGQVVIAEIVEYPGRHSQATGRVSHILGDYAAPGMEIDIAIAAHDLPHEWPKRVVKAAEGFGGRVAPSDKKNRLDLRHLPLVTIDGEDARDFDDAVYCEPRKGGGWRLLVAIADVAHYVDVDKALDREARKRGTSVYFARRVIPMLPEVLSNGLCSLNPKVDRLCVVCEMIVTPKGKVETSRFHNGVMRSKARLTYTEVAAGFEGRVSKKLGPLMKHLENLEACYQGFLTARKRRGAIEFEMPQTYMVLGEDRRVERIERYERNVAHRIIEECMIAANVQAAKFLKSKRIAALYRIHDGPVDDRLDELRGFLSSLGLRLSSSGQPKPRDFAKLLRETKGRADSALIETVLLRSLSRAEYTPGNIGHFGLALPEYAHFTSPIRRYPDLLVHRAIKHLLAGGKPRGFRYQKGDMERLGAHCSTTERRADDATRDATEWLKCEFMQDKVGQEFDAMITGVTNFGLFVQLTDVQIEGLVHVSSLDNDYYHHEPMKHALVGERTGKVFSLTDKMKVRLIRVDVEERKIDFEPVDEGKGKKQKTREKKRKRRRNPRGR
ncbi:MAG: ribonuclease R [Pseudomonadota bacterium]